MLKKKSFYIVVAIVAILLVGLILVQLYWVKNAYRLKEVEFNNRVQGILEKAADFANKRSASFNLYARSYLRPDEELVILKSRVGRQGARKDTLTLFNAFPYYDRPDTCFFTTGTFNYGRLSLMDISLRFEMRGADTALNITEKNRELHEVDSSNYRQRLEDMRPANKLVKPRLLDSAIRSLVATEGIDTGFAYGVRKKGQKNFDIISDQRMSAQLEHSAYKTELFTGRAFIKPYELLLFIRNKDNIIRSTLIWTLTISSIIIILLISAFIYFFRTVLAQKKLSEMKTDFINNMTHEFMTPVTNIALALETLGENKLRQTQEDEGRIMQVIATENAHLRDNINKVLQVAVLEKGSFLIDPAPVNLHQLLQRVARSFDIPVKLKKGNFRFDLHANHPVIIADETHIINLFYNIIDNAVKYSGAEPLLITVRSGSANKKIWISIQDNGKGMNADVKKNIFDKFYRGSTGNVHDVKGFGLGLTYVKSIAEVHGISIDVKSTVGEGTIFTLWFNQ